MNERRKHGPEFKAKVALEALKNQMTLSELSSKYDVNPHVIHKWKNEFLSKAFRSVVSTFRNYLL